MTEPSLIDVTVLFKSGTSRTATVVDPGWTSQDWVQFFDRMELIKLERSCGGFILIKTDDVQGLEVVPHTPSKPKQSVVFTKEDCAEYPSPH
ncbi:hypothetical protein [Pantanalinema sp. GBBB05]|uniref:hypothetical protein n=1 Tax=Pantanalinema sp. GBBB05 TaxID=2604139 RepID=UPI001D91B598|nr:hypothetical protein [Pantanalinema sp. GBBB05]